MASSISGSFHTVFVTRPCQFLLFIMLANNLYADSIHNITVQNQQNATIKCSGIQRINILSAQYASTSHGTKKDSCPNTAAVDIMRLCNLEVSCQIRAHDDSKLPAPCTSRPLVIQYNCSESIHALGDVFDSQLLE